jgi:CBS domain containing-hemolysin-like protein
MAFELQLVAGLVAVGTAAWAGLLALAEESPAVQRALADAPAGPRDPIPLHRALHTARLALQFIAGMSAGTAVGWWYRPSLEAAGSFAFSVVLLFLLGEALPRTIGYLLPEAAAAFTSAARRSLLPFRPLLGIIGAVERVLQKQLKMPKIPQTGLGTLHRDMLVGVFSLRDTTVAEIMTPRLDVFAVEHDNSWAEIVDALRRSEHARIPVYRDGPDDVAGILFAKDLMPAVSGSAPVPERWQDLIKPPDWVPETKTIEAQLRDFERNQTNIAIVVDEFGGTSGIVTPEDVIEEIVGEIRDEYDVHETPPIEREAEGKFWVDGGVPLDDLSEEMGTTVENDEVSTVGGLIYLELGRVPRPGEELRIADYRVVVEQVVKRRIKRVYFERLPEVGVPQDGGSEL